MLMSYYSNYASPGTNLIVVAILGLIFTVFAHCLILIPSNVLHVSITNSPNAFLI